MGRGIAVVAVFCAGCSVIFAPDPPGRSPDAGGPGTIDSGAAGDAQLGPDGGVLPDSAARLDAGLEDPSADPGCPAECDLGCEDEVCLIGCVADDSCAGPTICPEGLDCQVVCAGDRSCLGDVTCPAASTCWVECLGIDSCPAIACAPGQCTIDCVPDSCAGQ